MEDKLDKAEFGRAFGENKLPFQKLESDILKTFLYLVLLKTRMILKGIRLCTTPWYFVSSLWIFTIDNPILIAFRPNGQELCYSDDDDYDLFENYDENENDCTNNLEGSVWIFWSDSLLSSLYMETSVLMIFCRSGTIRDIKES